MRGLVFFLLASLLAGGARAGELTVMVRTPGGAPVRDAVVTLQAASAPAGPIRFDWPYRMAQEKLQFTPFVLIVPVGAVVAFPNHDDVRHQVYSFSPAHPFELKLYGRDETRTVKFDKVGLVALGCNIHDSMVAFIKVVDTPYAAKTDAAGLAVIHDAPEGAATLRVWHPYLKAPGNELARPLSAGSATARLDVTADVRAAPNRSHAY